MTPPPVIADVDAARTMFAALANEGVEVAEAVFLDPQWRYLGRTRFVGATGSVTVSIRHLGVEALAANASRVVLAHNHPSGDPEPSGDDLTFTRLLAVVLMAMDMPLADHLIVGRTDVISMRSKGYL